MITASKIQIDCTDFAKVYISFLKLGTTGRQIDVPCRFGVQYEVMDVTSSRVQGFIEDVLDEIITIFPSPVIHIGGDEVKFDQWNASTSIQKYMTRQGIETPADL